MHPILPSIPVISFTPTVLALYGRGDLGKTSTIREFTQALLLSYPHHRIITGTTPATGPGDFSLIVEVNGRFIGIESMGDPNTNLKNRLIDLVSQGCEVIICATRTKGDTVSAVENLEGSFGFQAIWTAGYQLPNSAGHHTANALMGGHMLELLQALGII